MSGHSVTRRNQERSGSHSFSRRKNVDFKVGNVFLYLLAYLSFAAIYATYSVFKWGYMGLVYDPSFEKIALGTISVLIFSVVMPKKWDTRTVYLNIILMCYIIPSSVIFGVSNMPYGSMFTIWTSCAIVYTVSFANISLGSIAKWNPKLTLASIILLGLLLIASIVMFGGMGNFNLNLERVYDVRDDISDGMPKIFGYLLPAFTKAALPFSIAISLYFRSYLMTAGLIVMSVVMFGLSSHKIMLFSPFIVIALYIYLSMYRNFSLFIIGFTAIMFTILIATIVMEYIGITSFFGWLESMLVWRSLIVPSYLDFGYIDIFSQSQKYYWSTSQITFGFITPPYDGMSPANIVGKYMFGTTVEANTGFIGSGFAQAGFLGAVLYSLGVGFMIALFNGFEKKFGTPFVVSATAILFLTMVMSTDFVGLFLTHGLLALLFLLFATARFPLATA